MPTGVYFMQHGIDAVFTPRSFNSILKDWCVPEHRSQSIFRPSLGHFDCRLQHQHGGRVLVDVVAYNIVDDFGLADLSRRHNDDRLNVGVVESIHYASLIFGSGSEPPPRLSACFC
jgi:hypothetical protein